MAKRDIQTVKAWRDQRDGSIYSMAVHGLGQAHTFSGHKPGKLPGSGTLPRLDQVAGELAAQGYKEVSRRDSLNGEMTVTYERVTPENSWEQFDMARAQNTPAEATEGATTGDPADHEGDTGAALRDSLDSFNRTIRF